MPLKFVCLTTVFQFSELFVLLNGEMDTEGVRKWSSVNSEAIKLHHELLLPREHIGYVDKSIIITVVKHQENTTHVLGLSTMIVFQYHSLFVLKGMLMS